LSDPAVEFFDGWLDGRNPVGEFYMPDQYQSMSHSKWDCKYHVVFVPKYRRSVLYGKIRQHLGKIFHELARQKECQIVEGHIMPDHVHMCIAIPPKHSVASVIGFIKGKSAIAIARQFSGKARNFNGESFWARGYAVSTVGFDEEQVKGYIRNQEGADGGGRF
jgi:putative transposase